MAFDNSFLEELRTRINIVELVGRRVQLKKRGREHWGCCPFHHEKTASFKVSEDRERYHCFGCGADGSAIDFVMNTEGLSFPEAVESLAESAGLQVPKSTPADKQRHDRLTRLREANEAAAQWFQTQLASAAGQDARHYLQGRLVSDEAISEFRLGYAPDRNDGLKTALLARGFQEQELVEAGLLAVPDDGRASYDRFRNRLMFPIADRQGRLIAFGGRALGDARAKYLNSPETPLFDKSSVLYNLAMAREASRKAGTVLVAEGYMDVIALAQHGFRHAVAPLGTAMTEQHIQALWRMAAEPILCLDGDAAGQQAALRAAERALPVLKPGKSLRFVTLPEGMDPDDLLKQEGEIAMQERLHKAKPLVDVLWTGKAAGRDLDTPERIAGLRVEIFGMLNTIEDEGIKELYQQHLREKMKSIGPGGDRKRGGRQKQSGNWRSGFGQGGKFGSGFGAGRGGRGPEDTTALRGLAHTGPAEVILSALLQWPVLVDEFHDELTGLPLDDSAHMDILEHVLDAAARESELDSEKLTRQLKAVGLADTVARLQAPKAAKLNWTSEKEQSFETVRLNFVVTVRRLWVNALEKEHREAVSACKRNPTEEAWVRLNAVQQELAAARTLAAQEPDAFTDEQAVN